MTDIARCTQLYFESLKALSSTGDKVTHNEILENTDISKFTSRDSAKAMINSLVKKGDAIREKIGSFPIFTLTEAGHEKFDYYSKHPDKLITSTVRGTSESVHKGKVIKNKSNKKKVKVPNNFSNNAESVLDTVSVLIKENQNYRNLLLQINKMIEEALL